MKAELFSPVDCDIVFNLVGDPYDHGIIFHCIESWPRELPIDSDNGFCCT